MKRLLLCVLLLAGCSIDTSATDERPAQLDFPFQIEHVGLLPASKVQSVSNTVHYRLYTTEKQAAFLKSNEEHLHATLNGEPFDNVEILLGTRTEIGGVTLYNVELIVSIDAPMETITSLGLSIGDKELLWTEHNRIEPQLVEGAFQIRADITDQDDNVYVYNVWNDAYEDVEIKRLYVEGVNGVRIDFAGFPQVIPQKGELRLIQQTLAYNEQRIQGPLGIYAVFADNSEQLIGLHQYVLAVEHETLLNEVVKNIRASYEKE